MGIKNKNLQVVGLRGLACLMVVLYHLIYRFQELYTNTNYNQFKIAYWGQIGVIIFMTLSAYYIYNERNSFINLKYYYFKNFLDYGLHILCQSL